MEMYGEWVASPADRKIQFARQDLQSLAASASFFANSEFQNQFSMKTTSSSTKPDAKAHDFGVFAPESFLQSP
jgi:hypothetical protein